MTILNFKIDTEKIEAGLDELANTVRIELYENHRIIFDNLDYNDNTSFMLPDTFYYISAAHRLLKSISLEQLLLGFNTTSIANIEVNSDEDGLIYLPNIGNLLVQASTNYNLSWNKIEKKITIYHNNKDFFSPLLKDIIIPNTDIKIRMSKNYFLINNSIVLNETVQKTIENYLPILISAWEKLVSVAPEFIEIIKKTTRDICLFNGKNQNSFAALSHFGTAFINVAEHNGNEIFFIDDISHQCGHTIFYTITLDMQSYFIINPHTSLSLYSEMPDNRTVYDVFHGLFTYTTTLESLFKCDKSGLFSKNETVEIKGRISFYMQKFKHDIGVIKYSKILSEKGNEFYLMFVESFKAIYSMYYESIEQLKFSQQPYFYSHSIFLYENKLVITKFDV